MKTIKRMVEEAILDSITESDIEEAVNNIVDGLDIADLLSDSDTLRDHVYSYVNDIVESAIEMFL